MNDVPPLPALATPDAGPVVRRHGLVTRVWHWLNAAAVIVLLMSGMMIFNAYPRLHWGQAGSSHDPAWLELAGADGLAFPGWATIPSDYSLADARLWHLAFAWLLALGLTGYLLWALFSGHIRARLRLTRAELVPRHIARDIADHARLRFPTGAAALQYNVLQKIAYAAVLFVLLPGLIATGLAMAPAMDAAWPWLVDLFGGRQSARTMHFLFAAAMAGFIVLHIVMVILAGPVNELRSITTGRYRVPSARGTSGDRR
jgi:thiosulfate reductase cytochrome b subunit